MKTIRAILNGIMGYPFCPVCGCALHFKHGTWNCRTFCDPYSIPAGE